VKSPVGFPYQRIAIAVTLSVLAHSILLLKWPQIRFKESNELPVLQAKLEPLPKPPAKVVARKPKTQPPSTPPQTIVETIAPAVSATPALNTDADYVTTPMPTVAGKIHLRPKFPKHARLSFSVQYADGTFKLGEIIHQFETGNGRYTLQAETQTTGLVGIFKNYHLSQTSTGEVTEQGLRPENYKETKTDSGGTQTSTVRFDWSAQKAIFADKTERPLPEQTLDVLSLPYQLSQLPLDLESLPISLSNGRNLNQYFIAIGAEELISTAMGELRTIPLRKVPGENEDSLIIWLALEYRLLPVKMLYFDKFGETTANMLITDIRVSDE
jgi:hypothetical protein